uniref:Disintegrin domain-containing protein n=1 Tax=Echinostoma caproni TaxID=27848 RepID=A0A183B3M1_9TREM
LGHNFGAHHDNEHQSEPYGCLPSPGDPRGNYIMFSSATNGDKENNHKFSRCSSDSIARFINHLSNDGNDCFVDSDGPFCGNKLVETGEECDCGISAKRCRDQCCNSRESASPCKLVDHILVNGLPKKAQCSMTAGECCDHQCQFHSKTRMCREATECQQASYCSGQSAKCPDSKMLPDGRICQDPQLQKQYPELSQRILRRGVAMRMSPGTPCDNYRGYCDAFHRCVSVNVQGPLARLRDALFSQEMLEKVKSWVTVRDHNSSICLSFPPHTHSGIIPISHIA